MSENQTKDDEMYREVSVTNIVVNEFRQSTGILPALHRQRRITSYFALHVINALAMLYICENGPEQKIKLSDSSPWKKICSVA